MNGKIMLNGKAYNSSGRPSKEVTMAEYLALPDSKYTNGVAYYIKDVGSASQYPPLIYSDYEREVGVWRDGKPLYQKTVYISSLPNNTETRYPTGITGVETVFIKDGFVNGMGALNVIRMLYPHAAIGCRADLSNGEIVIIFETGSDRTSSYARITLQYTKTTDLPGSGMWNTDGGKMHHYSTDEKVVGSWIDGKPIYEKTIELESQQQIASGSWYNLPMSNTGIAKIISVTAMNQTGTRWECVGANCDVGSYCQLANFRSDYIGVKVITLQYTKTTD